MSSSPAATETPASAEPSTAIARTAEAAVTRAPITLGAEGLELRTLDDAFRFARYVATSGLAPKGLDTPEKILVALQLGAEAGLRPMAALRNIIVINGMPSWKGDGALAMCRSSKLWKPLPEGQKWKGFTGQGDQLEAFVTTWRKGDPEPVTTTFSVADAKTAGLWGKSGPWTNYPKRMLYYRALGFNLRDQFTDLLGGFPIAEEAEDYPASIAAPAPVAAPPAAPGPGKADPLLAGIEAPTAAAPAEPEPEFTAPMVNPDNCPHPRVPPSLLANTPKGEKVRCPDCGTEEEGEARVPGEDDEPTPEQAVRVIAQAAAPERVPAKNRKASRSLLDDEPEA